MPLRVRHGALAGATFEKGTIAMLASEHNATNGITAVGEVEPDLIAEHLHSVSSALQSVDVAVIARVVANLRGVEAAGGSIHVTGNGGSAATALHFAADLVGLAVRTGRRIDVRCPVANPAVLSALSNDLGYENAMALQLTGLRSKDAVLLLSASGNSENCVRVARLARERGAWSLALVGFEGGRLKDLCDAYIHVPTAAYQPTEDVHSVVLHAMARAMEGRR